jgi:hypothetical protein
MKRFAFALVAMTAFAAPVAAQTLSGLLPAISFPEDEVITSSKGCDTGTSSACRPRD